MVSSPLIDSPALAARAAADRSGVVVRAVDSHEDLRAVDALLGAIWTSPNGASPMPSDLLRGLEHAGGHITGAFDSSGELCGAAVGVISLGSVAHGVADTTSTHDAADTTPTHVVAGTTPTRVAFAAPSLYSLVAGVTPGSSDRGIGFALKLEQRAWCLERGIRTIQWTFDPLVSRNARFNLSKLGARVSTYLADFYGPMGDTINGDDDSDRLVAEWPLDSDRAALLAAGNRPGILSTNLSGSATVGATAPDAAASFTPELPGIVVLGEGPDRMPALVSHEASLWLRVPTDIVALRGRDEAEAKAWRTLVREEFTTAFTAGYCAVAVTATGWYQLTKENS